MLYITQTQLMRESERAVLDCATSNKEVPRRVCRQLLADPPRYAHWHWYHEVQMNAVADARRRERQVIKLRTIAIEKIHRTALVHYLREGHIVGAAREHALREFYGIADPRDAVLAEHRNYVLAASTQLCASDILEQIGDQHGLDLIHSYELAYTQYFAMFCDRARASQTGEPYLLAPLMPEVKDVTSRLRLRILDSQLLRARPATLTRRAPLPAIQQERRRAPLERARAAQLTTVRNSVSGGQTPRETIDTRLIRYATLGA